MYAFMWMCTLHVSVDIILRHSCVNPQMWIAVYISMTNLLFHIVFLKHHEKQMLIKKVQSTPPGGNHRPKKGVITAQCKTGYEAQSCNCVR